MSPGDWLVVAVAALATAGVILRPFGWAEYIWAVAGALVLAATGLLPGRVAWEGVAKGGEVYLFLTGMMLLAEISRQHGLFGWLAARAVRAARGSAAGLFTLVFAAGTLVTVFLSNDATAVVLTPAVAAVAQAAGVRDRLPYLFVCAFVANAASFVLPISNPANLVVAGSHMPPLFAWLRQFALPSALAIGATYAMLRWTQRDSLREAVAAPIAPPGLPRGGVAAAWGIGATALVLLGASAADAGLGVPTFLAGAGTCAVVLARSGGGLSRLLRGVSWGVLPLVGGLFVLVEAVGRTGMLGCLAAAFHGLAAQGATASVWASGIVVALACNLLNNLPAGLVAGRVMQTAEVGEQVRAAVLIGVDLGPNLSVTGSLATILWLTALRREGIAVSAWAFLKLGAVVMPPALALALLGVLVQG